MWHKQAATWHFQVHLQTTFTFFIIKEAISIKSVLTTCIQLIELQVCTHALQKQEHFIGKHNPFEGLLTLKRLMRIVEY